MRHTRDLADGSITVPWLCRKLVQRRGGVRELFVASDVDGNNAVSRAELTEVGEFFSCDADAMMFFGSKDEPPPPFSYAQCYADFLTNALGEPSVLRAFLLTVGVATFVALPLIAILNADKVVKRRRSTTDVITALHMLWSLRKDKTTYEYPSWKTKH